MIKHIVMWRLKGSAHGNDKATNARLIKEKLESLNGKIPGLLKLEVGIDHSATESSGDLVLYSEFASREALDAYQEHPAHKAVAAFVKRAASAGWWTTKVDQKRFRADIQPRISSPSQRAVN